MKEGGKKEKDMVMECTFIKVEIGMKVNSRQVKNMEKESLNQQMDLLFMLEDTILEKNMDVECGFKETTNMKEIISMEKDTERELCTTRMETNMRYN
jgi:hypothetical protein